MNNKLRVLTVDDEPLARQRIRRMLKDKTEISEVFEAANIDEAFVLIKETSPDIVYLDIQMPGGSGFHLLEKLRAENFKPFPFVIFVTAFDEFALKAFDFHALDYLLKPFEPARFDRSLDLVIQQISTRQKSDFTAKIERLAESLKLQEDYLEWVTVKKQDKISLFKIEDIMWIEAQGNYVLLYLIKVKHLLREKMDVLESKLDARKFIRIHRSTIINVAFIKEIEDWGKGEYKIVMADGKTLGVSKTYRANLDSFFRSKTL